MKKLLLTAVAASLVLGLAGCGNPYDGEAMYTARYECKNTISADNMYANLTGGEKADETEAMLKCLRGELPELSDDDLNRLDYLIKEAGW